MSTTGLLRLISLALMAGAVPGFSGCSGGAPPPPDRAEAAIVLRAVLEAWKSGGTPEILKSGPAAITVVDPAWATGIKLASFEIDEAGAQPHGYDLGFPVQLWLADEKKPPLRVRYVIALKPNRVVTRDFGS